MTDNSSWFIWAS